jgi:hemerythrin superfamily protein
MADQTSGGKNRSLVALLREDHQAVKDMLSNVGQPGTDQAQLFCQLVHDLVAHEVAEEEIVYPVVRRSVDGGEQLANARINEQQEAEELLAQMEKMSPTTAEFSQRMQQLKDAVLAHANQEETLVFPRLEASVDAERLNRLARAYKLARDTAPTHPHPHAPNTPPGNLVLGPVVAIMDRARDAARAAADKFKEARAGRQAGS